MIRGIHHVALATPDLDRLASWYVEVLGFEPVMRSEWSDRPIVDRMIGLDGSAARQVMLRAGNAYVEMFQYSAPAGRPNDPPRDPCDHGYTHFCLDVVDIEAEYERLAAAGMTFPGPLPTRDEMGGDPALRAIYGRDPDGNIIELQEVVDPDRVAFTLDSTDLIGGTT